MEAAGVELFGVLITRKLLILGIATRAKKAPLPDPLYVYCTKILFALQTHRHHIATQYPMDSASMEREKTPSSQNSAPWTWAGFTGIEHSASSLTTWLTLGLTGKHRMVRASHGFNISDNASTFVIPGSSHTS